MFGKFFRMFRRDMPTQTFEVQPFTIVLASPQYINDRWLEFPEEFRQRGTVKGFFNKLTRTMYIPYGYGDKFDAEVLQHEFRHLPEIEGDFHA